MTTPSIACGTSPPHPEQGADPLAKKALRAALLARRKALGSTEKHAADQVIGQRVQAWCAAEGVTELGVYHPIRQEPDLLAVYNALAAQGVHLSLPVVVDKDAPLVFRRWQPGDALEKDAFGTAVPGIDAAIVKPQALIIPCVGYSPARMRLGYGGGFYDRTLAGPQRPLAVGVSYHFGLAEFVSEAHDIALDAIITDAVLTG